MELKKNHLSHLRTIYEAKKVIKNSAQFTRDGVQLLHVKMSLMRYYAFLIVTF